MHFKGGYKLKGGSLPHNKVMEFTAVVRHYMNFLQKQKVRAFKSFIYMNDNGQFEQLVRIRNSQKGLPIWQHKQEILEMVKTNQVVIVAGDTGCGKSTQVLTNLSGLF